MWERSPRKTSALRKPPIQITERDEPRHRLEPKRLRTVHPRIERPASMVLIEAMRGAGVELKVEAALCIYRARGVYTEEAAALLGESALR